MYLKTGEVVLRTRREKAEDIQESQLQRDVNVETVGRNVV